MYLRLFGGASIDGPSGPVGGRVAQRHRLGLLALLALHPRLTREKVVAYLWPSASESRGRRLLSDSIYRIHRGLGCEAVVATGETLRLASACLPCDAVEFREAMETGDFERAVGLYAGPLLDGFFVPDADEFERWSSTVREELAREHRHALEGLATAAEEDGDTLAALRWWRRAVAADPLSTRMTLRLMRALAQAGERSAAIQRARTHGRILEEELGAAPDPEVVALLEQIRNDPAPVVDPRPAAPGASVDPGGAAPGASVDLEGSAHADSAGSAHADPAGSAHADPAGSAHADPAGSAGSAGSAEAAEAPEAPGSTRSTRPPQPHLPLHRRESQQAEPPPRLPERRRAGARSLPAAALAGVALLLASTLFFGSRSGDSATLRDIAVLPFADLGPEGIHRYFADGITEELIAVLGGVDGLRVVGRTSSFAFRNRDVDLQQIGAELGVGTVLEGSVRMFDDRLRVTARLVDVNTGYHLWSETYDRRVEDVLRIQAQIVRSIVTTLQGRLVEEAEPVPATPRVDAVAYDLYLQGRYFWHRRTEPDLRRAAEVLEEAVARAPEYARAHVGLGDAYAVLGFYDFLPPDSAFPRAKVAALRALELDPSTAAAHATLGYATLYHDWDGERAEEEFLRAITLAPSYSTAHQWYANLLTALGRFPEAEAAMRRAQELDPLSLIANAALGWVHYYAGEYDRSIAQCLRTLELDDTFTLAHVWSGKALERLGRMEEGRRAIERAIELGDRSAITQAALARILALQGDPERARAILASLQPEDSAVYLPSYEIARVYEALGERERVLAWLERAFRERSHSMVFLRVDPVFRSLHGDPAFEDLAARVGLEG